MDGRSGFETSIALVFKDKQVFFIVINISILCCQDLFDAYSLFFFFKHNFVLFHSIFFDMHVNLYTLNLVFFSNFSFLTMNSVIRAMD